jgi:hypothetical protein
VIARSDTTVLGNRPLREGGAALILARALSATLVGEGHRLRFDEYYQGYRAEGGPFARLKAEITALLGGSEPEEVRDDYGYTWLVVKRPPEDMSSLCTDLHAVNSTLEGSGFGPSLLCTTIGLRADENRGLALVYLYKRGTFYPFAPVDSSAQRRDNALELQVRALVSGDLPIEQDVSRWFPVWARPVSDAQLGWNATPSTTRASDPKRAHHGSVTTDADDPRPTPTTHGRLISSSPRRPSAPG